MYNFKYLQQYAYNVLMAGYSVRLTGGAGVGKTYVINKFIQDQRSRGRNVMVCAPTGIAALHINGVTVHNQFKLGIKPDIKHSIDDEVLNKLANTDTLIIDEIGFLRLDNFDHLVMYIFNANTIRTKANKPKLQVVLSGDFLQLPPVITEADREILKAFYGDTFVSGFAYESKFWDMLNMHDIVLTEIVRQNDIEFLEALNKLRVGDKTGIDYIVNNCSKAPIPDAINLFGINNRATERNIEELNRIQSDLYTHEAIITGAARITDTNAEKILALKIGARVMSLVNSTEDADTQLKYGNGSLGTVVSINADSVTVEFDSGVVENIGLYTWEVKQYDIVPSTKNDIFPKLEERIIGTVQQYPLKLAYAITIHKSQGQTYDAVNINPYAWDCGQLYVALSRAKKLDNIYISSDIQLNYVVVSLDVIKYYNSIVDKANKDLDTTVDLTASKKLDFDDDMNKLLSMLGGRQ